MKMLNRLFIAAVLVLSTTSIAVAKKDAKIKTTKRDVAQSANLTGWNLFKYDLSPSRESADFFKIAERAIPKPKCFKKSGCSESTYKDGGCIQAQLSTQEVYICKVEYVQPGGSSYLLYMIKPEQKSIESNELIPVPLDSEDAP